jgi:hypothetical protein
MATSVDAPRIRGGMRVWRLTGIHTDLLHPARRTHVIRAVTLPGKPPRVNGNLNGRSDSAEPIGAVASDRDGPRRVMLVEARAARVDLRGLASTQPRKEIGHP